MTFAIDFGTSNTVVTRWNAATQQPEIVFLPALGQQIADNPPLIPSLIYIEDAATGTVQAGQTVRDRGLDQTRDRRFFRNFKRGIGTPIQGFLPELDGRSLNFEQIGQWFVTEVVRGLQAQTEVTDLVFTVPVDSFEAYRHWLGGVCQSLGVEQVRMLDEPTAAALGYGLRAGETLLVLDFGGGTLDLSLVQLATASQGQPLGFILKWGQKSLAETSAQKPQTARVLAKTGDNLGGADIDNWLADHFRQTQGLDTTPLTLQLVERLKIQLSRQDQATVTYFDDETLDSVELALTRSQFEAILKAQGFFERLDNRMEQVLQQARRQGIAATDVDAVLVVGGTAQIPAVQTWLRGYFPQDKIRSDRPFTAVAEGALQLQRGLDLKDFLYHSYGVRYWNRREKRHGWHPIIPSGQPYPMVEPMELVLGASTEGQPSIELIIGELGEGEGMATEVFFEGDRLITRQRQTAATTVQPLNDRDGSRTIARLAPLGAPGSDRIRVLFQVDRDRTLRITVEDILTGETLLQNCPAVQLS